MLKQTLQALSDRLKKVIAQHGQYTLEIHHVSHLVRTEYIKKLYASLDKAVTAIEQQKQDGTYKHVSLQERTQKEQAERKQADEAAALANKQAAATGSQAGESKNTESPATV